MKQRARIAISLTADNSARLSSKRKCSQLWGTFASAKNRKLLQGGYDFASLGTKAFVMVRKIGIKNYVTFPLSVFSLLRAITGTMTLSLPNLFLTAVSTVLYCHQDNIC